MVGASREIYLKMAPVTHDETHAAAAFVLIARRLALMVSQLSNNRNDNTKKLTPRNSQKRSDNCACVAVTHLSQHISYQWRRQLWGTGTRVPPRLPKILFVVHSGVNLTANNPSIV